MEGFMAVLVVVLLVVLLSSKKKSKKKQASKAPALRNVVYHTEDLTRLTKDGELPYGWYGANAAFTERLENEYRHLLQKWIDAKDKGALKEYAALKSLYMYMKDAQVLCKSKGECFEFWSTFTVADPADMDQHKERLQYLEENMDSLLKKEKTLATLQDDLQRILKEEPGIIQADLYKRFAPELKNDISNMLYTMNAKGLIRREKNGRSYSLYMN